MGVLGSLRALEIYGMFRKEGDTNIGPKVRRGTLRVGKLSYKVHHQVLGPRAWDS